MTTLIKKGHRCDGGLNSMLHDGRGTRVARQRRFHWLMRIVVYGAGGVPPCAGAIPPRPIVEPSGNFTLRNWPPLVPSRSGWIVTETFIPGVSVFGFQPSRARPLGPLSSIAQTSLCPC